VTLYDYIEQGGVIMYILLVMSIAGVTIMSWKLVVIAVTAYRKKALLATFYAHSGGKDATDASMLERCLNEEIRSYLLRLEGGLNLVRVIASVAPLLGLLGTVIGILGSFEVISKSGLDDPTLFAEGISMALVTTVGGLTVSIPHYIGYSCLTTAIDRIEAAWNKGVVQILKQRAGQ
jgi:biopolymer transport protein ExbB